MDVVNHASFSADEYKSILKPTVSEEFGSTHEAPDAFPPLKSCASDVVDFPDVLGQVPGDFQLFDCAEAEEPLRILSNPNGDCVYPVTSTSYPAKTPRVLSESEHEVGNFWNALQVPAHRRLVPFSRYTMTKNANFDFRPSFLGGGSRLLLNFDLVVTEMMPALSLTAYEIYPPNELGGDAIAVLFSTNPWYWVIVQLENLRYRHCVSLSWIMEIRCRSLKNFHESLGAYKRKKEISALYCV